jgi:predicted glycoside hydrolase/deacetylase ChbG (UPF0249 family)
MDGVAITGSKAPSAHDGRRRLIINADDLGLSEGVNRGIVESAEYGVVTSASMLVNMPGWDDALSRLKAMRTNIGVGLHFNIVAGCPLTSAPTLADPETGAFYSLPQLTIRALMGKVNLNDVGAEFAAQLEKLRTTGIRITHVDSHRHVHALPGIGSVLVDVATAFGIRVMRTPLEPLSINAFNLRATLKKLALSVSWRVASATHPRVRRPARQRYVDYFFGTSLDGGRSFAQRLNSIVDQVPTGTSEIMVHPGYSDETLASVDGYTWQRECEVRALVSPALRTRLQRLNIDLLNFGALEV